MLHVLGYLLCVCSHGYIGVSAGLTAPTLSLLTSQNATDNRDCENKLMLQLGYEQFQFVKLLLINRWTGMHVCVYIHVCMHCVCVCVCVCLQACVHVCVGVVNDGLCIEQSIIEKQRTCRPVISTNCNGTVRACGEGMGN